MLTPRRFIFVVFLFQLFRQLFFGWQNYDGLFPKLQGRVHSFYVVLVLEQLHASSHALIHPLPAQNENFPHPRVCVFRPRRFRLPVRLFRDQMRHHVLLQIRSEFASIFLHHLLNLFPLFQLKPSHAHHAIREAFERELLVLVRQLARLRRRARVDPTSRYDWNVLKDRDVVFRRPRRVGDEHVELSLRVVKFDHRHVAFVRFAFDIALLLLLLVVVVLRYQVERIIIAIFNNNT